MGKNHDEFIEKFEAFKEDVNRTCIQTESKVKKFAQKNFDNLYKLISLDEKEMELYAPDKSVPAVDFAARLAFNKGHKCRGPSNMSSLDREGASSSQDTKPQKAGQPPKGIPIDSISFKQHCMQKLSAIEPFLVNNFEGLTK